MAVEIANKKSLSLPVTSSPGHGHSKTNLRRTNEKPVHVPKSYSLQDESSQKKALLEMLIHTVPRVPHQLDNARITSVLLDMVAQLRAAVLLPVMLLCTNNDKARTFNADVFRSLAFFRLHMRLASVQHGAIPDKSRSALSAGSDSSSEMSSVSDQSVSTVRSLTTATGCSTENFRMPHRNCFALVEAFQTVCFHFRDTFDYRLLQSAERLFNDDMAGPSGIFVTIRKLSDVMATVVERLRKHGEKTPYQHRQMQRKVNAIEEVDTETQKEQEKLFPAYEIKLQKYKETYLTLKNTMTVRQEKIFRCLEEVRRTQAEIEKEATVRRREERVRHQKKLSKHWRNSIQSEQESSQSVTEEYLRSKQFIQKMLDQKEAFARFQAQMLTNTVALKRTLFDTQNQLQEASKNLENLKNEQNVLIQQFEEIVLTRRTEEQSRAEAAASRSKQDRAARVIQRAWHRYLSRTAPRRREAKPEKKSKKKNGKKVAKK